jgi:preprotein translocase subunit SecD
MNATNYDALEAVLNATFSVRYDVVGGNEASGVFEVEGKNSEANRTEIEASLNKYLEILSFESKVSKETIGEVEKMIESRADFMGVSDLRIKRSGDIIIVESPERIAGNSSVLEPLDFEARLWTSGNITVRAFTSEDVSRVDHYYYVSGAGGWAVPMTLKRSAAEQLRDLALTHGAIDADETVRRKHPLGMFFNGVEVYNASFSSDLAQSMREEYVVSFLAITGGPRENDEARKRAEDLYINLEASFPTKLRTAGEGQIPAMLGKDFARQVVSAAAAAMVGVLMSSRTQR